MSLYNLWRARIGMALAAVVYGLSAAVYGFTHGWDHSAILVLTFGPWMAAALLFPWTRAQRPPPPSST